MAVPVEAHRFVSRAVRLKAGEHVFRYLAAQNEREPPSILVCALPGSRDAVDFPKADMAGSGCLEAPGAVLRVRALRDAKVVTTIVATGSIEAGDGVQLKIEHVDEVGGTTSPAAPPRRAGRVQVVDLPEAPPAAPAAPTTPVDSASGILALVRVEGRPEWTSCEVEDLGRAFEKPVTGIRFMLRGPRAQRSKLRIAATIDEGPVLEMVGPDVRAEAPPRGAVRSIALDIHQGDSWARVLRLEAKGDATSMPNS